MRTGLRGRQAVLRVVGDPTADPAPAPHEDNLFAMAECLLSKGGQAYTLVVLPSLTFDPDLLVKVPGVVHYEERLLVSLLRLRDPRLRLVFCSSLDLSDQVIDYFLSLIPELPVAQARQRLSLVSCQDESAEPLSRKLLGREDVLARIRAAIGPDANAGLVSITSTEWERAVSERLGIPLLGNPEQDHLGNKSGSREIFRAAGIALPDGSERLRDIDDVAAALVDLKGRNPGLQRAVVKLEEGFSGEGNAIFTYGGSSLSSVRAQLPKALDIMAPGLVFDDFAERFGRMGGIVEEFLTHITASPSGQAGLTPDADLHALSTHDQLLGGSAAQIYQGAIFPASSRYRRRVQRDTLAVGEILREKGARGRYAVDFVQSQGRLCAIEINLRLGGTTHPMALLSHLTNGSYDAATATFRSDRGQSKSYCCTDNLQSPAYVGLDVPRVLAAVAADRLQYDPRTQRGCVFHMLGGLADFGKVGVTCIADNRREAVATYLRLTRLLDDLVSSGDALRLGGE